MPAWKIKEAAGEAGHPYPCLDKVGLYSPQAPRVVCYPGGEGCFERLARLAGMGVRAICDYGSTELPNAGLRVLGKGHASVVATVEAREGVLALKSRRLDSRRESLSREASFLREASLAGVAPRPLSWDKDHILMDLVSGPSLGDLYDAYGRPPIGLLVEALRASYVLDSIGILHMELHRPWRNVFYSGWSGGFRALIIDYESARRGCGNVPRLATAVMVKEGGLVLVKRLRGLLSEYKKRGCPESLYLDIESSFLSALSKLLPESHPV